MKKRAIENEIIYQKYKYLLEKIKKKSKRSYYQRKLKLFEGNIKKRLLKKRGTSESFPKTLINDKVEITDTKTIANSCNNFFVKIGPNLASKIPKSDTNFEAYISKANTKLQENHLTENEFLKAFKSLKINKAPGFDQIDVNVINQIYNHIKKLLIRIFGDSIKLVGVFQEKLKGYPNF